MDRSGKGLAPMDDKAAHTCCSTKRAPESHAQGHDHHHHAAPGAAQAHVVKDPVCGMTVDPHTAKHRAEHHGQPYYFCSAKCREKFVADPQKSLSGEKQAAAPA